MVAPLAQLRYNPNDQTVEVVVSLADGTGDHVLATLPATPPPGGSDE